MSDYNLLIFIKSFVQLLTSGLRKGEEIFQILFILMHLLGYDFFLNELGKVSNYSCHKLEYLNDLIEKCISFVVKCFRKTKCNSNVH